MPNSIKSAGTLIATVSALLLAGSVAGFFMVDCLPVRTGDAVESALYHQTLKYGKAVALMFILLSVGSFLAGVFIARNKNWARVLMQYIAVVYLAYIWHQTLFVASGTESSLARGVLGSIPLLLLIRFLNKKQVKGRFRLL